MAVAVAAGDGDGERGLEREAAARSGRGRAASAMATGGVCLFINGGDRSISQLLPVLPAGVLVLTLLLIFFSVMIFFSIPGERCEIELNNVSRFEWYFFDLECTGSRGGTEIRLIALLAKTN